MVNSLRLDTPNKPRLQASKGVRHSPVFRSGQRTASHKRCSAPSPGAIAMAHSEWMCWQGLNVIRRQLTPASDEH
jgi:hypothetical protein